MTTLRDTGEFPLIERLLKRLPAASARVRVGPGDDAAVSDAPPEGSVLVSTVDLLVEGVDFTFDLPARSVGWKAVAVNLSDIAAMAAFLASDEGRNMTGETLNISAGYRLS